MIVLAALLFLQTLTFPQAYTVATDIPDHLGLAMDSGTFAIQLGAGCDGLTPGVNVLWLAGSGVVGAIAPIGTDVLCNVYIDQTISDEPCAVNTDGLCDIDAASLD